ncbi:hypothetical protein M2R47_09285 [Moraxella sp. Tifton1]|uniref:Uncharacterized protein n=1 Tax=Moraxella oculi TaxID=2940516 RepID=A0ABW8U9L3_9GAMM|nr:hypothetical protein [Moraxella sp. Tifton1]MCL1624419.1 hypothetical protein [Moraxella sp. Tifton1]
MSSQKISFKVMVMFSEVLEEVITKYNQFYETDFHITEVYDDDLSFCIIEATKYQLKDIFGSGYSLSVSEDLKKSKGELDW